jgi:hypothetical protein
MPCIGSVLGVERALMDCEYRLLEPRSASLGALVGPAMVTAGVQRRSARGRRSLRRGWLDALAGWAPTG